MQPKIERILRAMGWRDCSAHPSMPVRTWLAPDEEPSTAPTGCCRYSLPNPLDSWEAFGEILEWAEQAGYTWERTEDGTLVWPPLGVHRPQCGTLLPDFRTAFLVALSDAIGEQP